MNFNDQYIRQLEDLIANKLLPVYDKYYSMINQPKPELDVLIVSRISNKIPALFKPAGALTFASDERKPRKN